MENILSTVCKIRYNQVTDCDLILGESFHFRFSNSSPPVIGSLLGVL